MSLNIDGGGDVNIDDNITSIYSTWSSTKIASSGGGGSPIDTARLTNLESKTQNQSATVNNTSFTGNINANSIITGLVIGTGFKIAGSNSNDVLIGTGFKNSTIIPSIDNLNIQTQNIDLVLTDATRTKFNNIVESTSGFKISTGGVGQLLTANGSVNSTALPAVATNTTNIATNTSNIATNTGNIATNTSNIATNTSNIATNTSNIATNTSNITTLNNKTQNQTAVSGETSFTGVAKVNNAYISSPGIVSNQNLFITERAITSSFGSLNTIMGLKSSQNLTGGNNNTNYGANSARSATSTIANTAIGANALYFNINSSNNTAVGEGSLLYTTGQNNTAIGSSSNTLVIGAALNNTISLGYNSQPTVDNQCVIGNTSLTEVKSSGVFTSDIGFKIPAKTANDILTANGSVNSTALTSIATNTSDIATNTSSITTLNDKMQNQSATVGITSFSGMLNVSSVSAGLITATGFKLLNSTSYDVLIGTGTKNSTIIPAIDNLSIQTQNQSAISGDTLFNGTVTSTTGFKTNTGSATQFLKANGTVDSTTYATTGTLVNSAIPYINASGQLSSANTNLYVQAGVNTISSAISAITSGLGYSIQISSGSFTENLLLTNQNYILSGVSCPLFSPTTLITGNMTLGAVGVLTTRIKVLNIQLSGNLVFASDATNQSCRYYFSNCEFTGSITFPTAGVALTWIYFFDCSFSGSTAITFPNTSIVYVFTRCNFNNQVITNNVPAAALLTFRDCTGLNSLSVVNTTYYGFNATTAGVGSSNIAGVYTGTSFVKTGGLSSEFLKADGSVSTSSVSVSSAPSISNYTTFYNPTTTNLTYRLNTDYWRYQSWGYYAGAGLSVVDCQTTLLTNLGGSLGNLGIVAGTLMKQSKVRAQSVYTAVADGQTSGWLGAAVQNYLIPKAGFYIKIGFSLDAATTTSSNRTMIGLFQSTTQPVLGSAPTIAASTVGSMGIVQEVGETVFSFNTRGTTGSTKVASTITCQTPNNNWYMLEIMNEPFSSNITLVLTCQNSTTNTVQSENYTFTCGTTTTMPIATTYIHLQQSMTVATTNAAVLCLGNIIIKTP